MMSPQQVLSRTDKIRPAPGGCSVGHRDITAGTLGVLTNDGKILSNNHVLANANQGLIEDPILQPGPYDGYDPANRIAGLERFIEVKPDNNLVDAAIGLPDRIEDVTHEILEVGTIIGWGDPQHHMIVEKSGRTTGLTTSAIFDTQATITIDDYPYVGSAVFKDQIVVQSIFGSFADGGDSGSLVFTRLDPSNPDSEPVAIGLVFAGSDFVTVINKISNVIPSLGIDLGSYATLPEPVPITPPGFESLLAFTPLMFGLGIIISVENEKKIVR